MDHIGIDVHRRESQIYSLAQGGEVVEQRGGAHRVERGMAPAVYAGAAPPGQPPAREAGAGQLDSARAGEVGEDGLPGERDPGRWRY